MRERFARQRQSAFEKLRDILRCLPSSRWQRGPPSSPPWAWGPPSSPSWGRRPWPVRWNVIEKRANGLEQRSREAVCSKFWGKNGGENRSAYLLGSGGLLGGGLLHGGGLPVRIRTVGVRGGRGGGWRLGKQKNGRWRERACILAS